ncbi:MAG: hypothetical protein KDA76_14305 [Planctomycetaceae bacterium]|nr:hypothetical protein [Planctomycetaceae bacterium]
MYSVFCLFPLSRAWKLALTFFCVGLPVICGMSQRVSAAAKFPYEATIFTDNVEAHSGPGARFYVTDTLKKGAAVTVHRHDPGGWYMIAPPPGSFSLIRAEYVRRESPRQGSITENNVIVRVGSQVNSHNEVEQRRLMKGDRVNILGEVTLAEQGRQIQMLKIEPPRGEFRWVKGDYIVPSDPALRKVHDSDPYAIPSNGVEIERKEKQGNTPDLNFPIADRGSNQPRPAPENWDGKSGAVNAGYDPKLLEKDRTILNALDVNFRNMIQQDISTWNLRDLAHDYRKLQASTSIPPIANQVDLRLQAMERYRKIKAEYDDLVKLTSGTEQRDAQLLSLQKNVELAQVSPFEEWSGGVDDRLAMGASPDQAFEFLPYLGPVAESDSLPHNDESLPEPSYGSSTIPEPRPTVRPQAPWGPATQPAQGGHGPGAQGTQPFSGAGIVKQVGNGSRNLPPYVLVTPGDRLLAFLQPAPGVQLEQFLGQSIGVTGERRHDKNLQADLIQVTGFAPVRLAPQPD